MYDLRVDIYKLMSNKVLANIIYKSVIAPGYVRFLKQVVSESHDSWQWKDKHINLSLIRIQF